MRSMQLELSQEDIIAKIFFRHRTTSTRHLSEAFTDRNSGALKSSQQIILILHPPPCHAAARHAMPDR
jgi:hypothetical protein